MNLYKELNLSDEHIKMLEVIKKHYQGIKISLPMSKVFQAMIVSDYNTIMNKKNGLK